MSALSAPLSRPVLPSNAMSSCTARFSNLPEPLRNNRSLGSGQKPPCRSHRPRNRFRRCIQYPSMLARDVIVITPIALRSSCFRCGCSSEIAEAIRLAKSRSTSSSASKLKIQSPIALSMAEFFCAPKPFHSSTNTFAPNDFAIPTVPSFEPESTTMISPLPSATSGFTLASVRPMLASSLNVIMTTERFIDGMRPFPIRESVRGLEIVSHWILLLREMLKRRRLALDCFRQQKDNQDHQLRFDGMPVSSVRKYEVVDRGVGQHQSREKPRPGPLLAQYASESPEGQYRGCQKRRRAEVDRGNAVGRSRYAV